MQNTQHTPGPWRIGDNGRTIFGPRTSEPAPVTIAQIPPATPRVSASERVFNAALIGAAPELLEALEWMLREYCSHLQGNGYALEVISDLPQVKTARAAIAKAQGGASC